jgi:hypothetical protein
MSSVDSYTKNQGLRGYTSNDDLFGRLLQVLGNFNQRLKVNADQSVYDAYLRRERDRQYMQVQKNAFSDNAFSSYLGLNPRSPFMQGAGLMLGDPTGPVAQALKLLTGSNPMLAQSQLYGGLNGATLGAFGMTGGQIGPLQIQQMSKQMEGILYNKRTVDSNYILEQQKHIQDSAQSFFSRNQDLAKVYGVDPSHFNMNNINNSWINNDLKNNLQSEIKKIRDASDTAAKVKVSNDYLNNLPSNLQALAKNNFVDSSGVFNAEGFQKLIKADPGAYFSTAAGNLPKVGTQILAGMNYQQSRGFSEEEMSGNFLSAANLQLLGRQNISSAYRGFGKNSEGALDAFRPIAGAMGMGSDLVGAINSVLGPNGGDLTSKVSADKIEKLGRDVAAVARITGQNIKTLVDMNKSMQDIAAQHPELAYMGSSTMQFVLDNSIKAQALNSMLSPDASRAMGGSQGINNQLNAATLTSAQSVPNTMAAVAYGLAKQQGGGATAQLDKIFADYYKSAGTGVGGSYGSVIGLQNSIGNVLGIPRDNITAVLDRPELGGRYKNDPEIAAKAQAYSDFIPTAVFKSQLKGSKLSYTGLQNALLHGGADPIANVEGYLDKAGAYGLTNEFANNPVIQSSILNDIPGASARNNILNSIRDRSIRDDTAMSKDLAHDRSGLFQNYYNSLQDGDYNSIESAFGGLKASYYQPNSTKSQQDLTGKALDAFDTLTRNYKSKGARGVTGQDISTAFVDSGLKLKASKSQIEEAYNALNGSSINSVDALNKELTNPKSTMSKDAKAFFQNNPDLINQDVIDAGNSGELGDFGAKSITSAVDAPRVKAVNTQWKKTFEGEFDNMLKTSPDLTNDQTIKGLIKQYGGVDQLSKAAAGAGSLSTLVASAKDSKGNQLYSDDEVTKLSSLNDVTQKINDAANNRLQADGTTKQDEEKSPTDILQSILDTITGKGKNAIADSLGALATTIGQVK